LSFYQSEFRWPPTRRELIVMTGNGSGALARLGVFVGEWIVEASFPGGRPAPSGARGEGPRARSRFEWALDGQFLLQRTDVPVPEVPDSLTIVSAGPQTGAYTQHYYDSRGVVRLYAMTFADGVWTLTRESPTADSHWILAKDGRPDHRIPVPLG
jgi:hypothetical protein